MVLINIENVRLFAKFDHVQRDDQRAATQLNVAHLTLEAAAKSMKKSPHKNAHFICFSGLR